MLHKRDANNRTKREIEDGGVEVIKQEVEELSELEVAVEEAA